MIYEVHLNCVSARSCCNPTPSNIPEAEHPSTPTFLLSTLLSLTAYRITNLYIGLTTGHLALTAHRLAREAVLGGAVELLLDVLRIESQVTGFNKLPPSLAHAANALLAMAGTPAGLMALLRSGAIIVCLKLQVPLPCCPLA